MIMAECSAAVIRILEFSRTNGTSIMDEAEIANKLAVQTALTYSLAEELMEADVIERNQLLKRLYNLLGKHGALGGEFRDSGAIRHLIYLIESQEV